VVVLRSKNKRVVEKKRFEDNCTVDRLMGVDDEKLAMLGSIVCVYGGEVGQALY
jgi:hypothetical protein